MTNYEKFCERVKEWVIRLELTNWIIKVNVATEPIGENAVAETVWTYAYLDAEIRVEEAALDGLEDYRLNQIACHECVHLFLAPYVAAAEDDHLGLSNTMFENLVTALQRKFTQLERGY